MANVDGGASVTIRELIRTALRMRPDRIIVGEVRGGEAMDMLQALNTGHPRYPTLPVDRLCNFMIFGDYCSEMKRIFIR